eukprot:1147972-Pelagomonas_calceolata.AAC.9
MESIPVQTLQFTSSPASGPSSVMPSASGLPPAPNFTPKPLNRGPRGELCKQHSHVTLELDRQHSLNELCSRHSTGGGGRGKLCKNHSQFNKKELWAAQLIFGIKLSKQHC